MVIYFTGTGNSLYAARMIASRLEDRIIDSAQFIREKRSMELESESPWVFVAPVYAWRLPAVFLDLISRSSFSGCRKAYFLATCGGDAGDPGAGLEQLCEEKQLEYMGLLSVTMPNNYVVMSNAPRPDEAAGIIADAIPHIRVGIGHIRRGEKFPVHKPNLIDKIKSGPINKGFCLSMSSAKFSLEPSCTGCGICAAKCPTGNISMDDEGRPVWGNSCTQCLACVNWCPVEAVNCGRSKGKTRHRCPEYSGE